MTEPVFQVRGLSKCYGSVSVLSEVDLALRPGEAHALLGANGAGKSTLSRIIAGLVQPTSGAMEWMGAAYRPASKREAERSGIEIVQQEFNLIPTLSVAENLFFKSLPSFAGLLRKRKLMSNARRLLDEFELSNIDPAAPVSTLGVGHQQMIEIAAAFSRSCELLILDEPTAALSQKETDLLFDQLARLKREGKAILFISHRLDDVTRICERFTVLRDGRRIIEKQVADCTSQSIAHLISGEAANANDSSLVAAQAATRVAVQPTALSVENLCCGSVHNVSLQVAQGEVLGIAGLVGSGRTQLLRAIFGADKATGTVHVANREVAPPFKHPAAAVRAGLAMVTEDRKQNGLLLTCSISQNSTLSSLRHRFSHLGWLRLRQERTETTAMCQRMNTRCESIDQSVGHLSGGNQQKVVLAKWLIRDAQVFLMDEPTRGIDVAARDRVHQLIRTLSNAGKAVLVVSSEVEELLAISDRIAVMSQGQIVKVFERDAWSKEAIIQASFVSSQG